MSLGSITGGDQSMRRVVERLEARIAELERSARAIPARLPAGGGGAPVTLLPTAAVLQCDGGNTLGTVHSVTITGIKPNSSTGIQEVPVKTPVAGTTYANGLGYGRAVINGVAQGQYQWVASKVWPPDSIEYSDFNGYLIERNGFASVRSVRLPVTGSASNANLTATMTAGVLTGITIVSGGSGYTADAGIWIPGGTRNATVTLTVSGGAITGFTIVDGGAYSFTPTILTRGDTSPVWLPYYV